MAHLSLRRSMVMRHWQRKSPHIARVINLMETMEEWMMDDHEQVAKGLDRLAPRLERSPDVKLLAQTDPMLTLMAYLSSGRTLMLMDWMDQKFQGRVGLRMIDYAKQSKEQSTSRLLLERLQTLHSLSLLPQVFSPERMHFISMILQDLQKNMKDG